MIDVLADSCSPEVLAAIARHPASGPRPTPADSWARPQLVAPRERLITPALEGRDASKPAQVLPFVRPARSSLGRG